VDNVRLRKRNESEKFKEEAPDRTLENSLWKRLWTCHKTDYRMSDEGQEIFLSPGPNFINVKPTNKNPPVNIQS
jgi:hypothetical protein